MFRPEYGLDGNVHKYQMNRQALLEEWGIKYLGDGEWELPACWNIFHVHGDDWLLVEPDGTEWSVWGHDPQMPDQATWSAWVD